MTGGREKKCEGILAQKRREKRVDKCAKVTEKMGRLGKMDGGAKVQVGQKRVFFEVFLDFSVR